MAEYSNKTGRSNTIRDYLRLAEIFIAKWGTKRMLLNDDIISNVATAIMWAENRFDGRGSLKGYIGYCGRMAVIRELGKLVKEGKCKNVDCISISRPDISEYDTIDMIKQCRLLTDNERTAIYDYFFLNKTLREIASDIGISHQTVSNIINRGLDKLRKELDV